MQQLPEVSRLLKSKFALDSQSVRAEFKNGCLYVFCEAHTPPEKSITMAAVRGALVGLNAPGIYDIQVLGCAMGHHEPVWTGHIDPKLLQVPRQR
ncbi:hypothetical protein [Leptolyngbya sp. FACHB-261]|uniref:hypothetical protein n=1 Tax=Leptolyngbya sp. FACHB-261 TaxID=2692806 RepID=UPI001687DC17|nr:hypothetical protein [Leptolyngbya sp. FACHB-261]MBD2103711.1 hypothetical protein [Leptolyngbya sp. FACHB-261]